MKRFTVLLPLLFSFLSGCVSRSALRIDEGAKRSEVFQYCGGQQWGFVKSLSKEPKSPFQAVYLEFDTSNLEEPSTASEVVMLNFVLQGTTSLQADFQSRTFKIYKDDQLIYEKPSDFVTIRGAKSIQQLYPGDEYLYDHIPSGDNEWLVRRKKYGGMFGQMLLEESFVVKIPTYPNQVVKSNKVDVAMDETMDEVYIFEKLIVPFHSRSVSTAKLKFVTPAYIVNGITVPESNHIFYFDRARVLQNMAKGARCASMEQIFRFARAKGINPLNLLLTPVMID